MILHVHNGDESANILKQSTLPGEHLAWREALVEGPTPAGISGGDWLALRAKFLSENYGTPLEETLAGLKQQQEALEGFDRYSEITLWFEHDLFCQTLLAYLLNWFSYQTLGNTYLSLVCVDHFPGIENFRGLGQLTPDQMASLYNKRVFLSANQLELGAKAWQAYCVPDPSVLIDMLHQDLSLLPPLKPSFEAHLKRFPNTENGLGNIENRLLELVSAGCSAFHTLFSGFQILEPLYGLGDLQLWNAVVRLGSGLAPVLGIATPDGDDPEMGKVLQNAEICLTETGEALLENKANYLKLVPPDAWLGGVHLTTDNLWCWDEATRQLARC